MKMHAEIKLPIFKVPIWIFHFLPTLRKPLQGIEESYFLVEAENKAQARLSLTKSADFWKNYGKLPTQERKKLRPFKLKREGRIERILACSKRHKNSHGEYICGKPTLDSLDSNGEFGMCCIIGYDPFESEECPYYRRN